MQAVILAGGLGTRLRPVVSDRPKPIAEVAGRPFLEYILLQLSRQGVHDVVLCIGHMGASVRAVLGTGARWGLSITYSQESEPKGTGGALKLAEPHLRDRFFVLNGDSFFDISLAELLAFHVGKGALATIALGVAQERGRYGIVRMDDDGRVLAFEEKSAEASGPMNGGIYVFERSLLSVIASSGAASLERDIFPRLTGDRLFGRRFDAYFVDIGVPADYLRLQSGTGQLPTTSN